MVSDFRAASGTGQQGVSGFRFPLAYRVAGNRKHVGAARGRPPSVGLRPPYGRRPRAAAARETIPVYE